jgi:hypothetical protein
MKPDLAETTAADTLESRVENLERVMAATCANLGTAMDMMGAAFKAMSNPGGFTIYGLKVVDSEGRTVATLAPGGDRAGELVLYDPASGASVALRP